MRVNVRWANLMFFEDAIRTIKLTVQPATGVDTKSRIVTRPEPLGSRVVLLLEKHPEYRKTLSLAVAFEESTVESPEKGWQWHDVETHPTKLIRLVTEGITVVNEKSRQATRYRLRDWKIVKESLMTYRRDNEIT